MIKDSQFNLKEPWIKCYLKPEMSCQFSIKSKFWVSWHVRTEKKYWIAKFPFPLKVCI